MLAADTDAPSLAGLELVDRRGERIGRVRQVYPDGERLGWVGVRGNLFGTEEVLVPLDGAELEDDVIGVPLVRARFQSAPRRRPDAVLEDAEREQLRAYWSAPEPEPAPAPAPAPAATSAADEQEEPLEQEAGVMTASEERLRVETERVPRTRVRLKKVVVTEQRSVTVPVRREEYRLVREPIVDGEPVAGGTIGPDEQEVVLYEERLVVTTEVVPVERIRLVKEEVVEDREVSGEVRRERIELVDEESAAEVPAVEPEPVHETDADEPIEADGPTGSGSDAPRSGAAAASTEIIEPRELEAPKPQLEARAMSTKRPTSSRSPRKPGSTPARSRTSAAADAPPSTGAKD